MSRNHLVIAALGFSLITTAACGPKEEEQQDQPITQTTAQQALQQNMTGMATSLEENVKFLEKSKLFMSGAEGALGGEGECTATVIDGPDGPETVEDCTEPDPITLDDMGATEGASELVKLLNEHIFVDANIESAEERKLTYLLKGETVCPALVDEGETPAPGADGEPMTDAPAQDDMADCKDFFAKAQLRLVVTAPAAGDLRVDLLVGPDKNNPLSLDLFRKSAAVEADLGEGKKALTFLAAQLGEEAPELPDTFEGRVKAALKMPSAQVIKGELSIIQAVKIKDAQDNLDIALGAANPAVAVTLDAAQQQLTSELNMGSIDTLISLIEDAETGDLDPGVTPPAGTTAHKLKVHLGGLSSRAILKADTDVLTVENIGWGDEAGTLEIDGKKVFEALLNPSAGHRLGLTLTPAANDEGMQVELQPGLDLGVLLKFGQLEQALQDKLDIAAWMQNDDISIKLSGTNPTVLLGDALKVISGKLTVSSTAANVNVTVDPMMCLLPGEGGATDTTDGGDCAPDATDCSSEAPEAHPFEGLQAGACGGE